MDPAPARTAKMPHDLVPSGTFTAHTALAYRTAHGMKAILFIVSALELSSTLNHKT